MGFDKALIELKSRWMPSPPFLCQDRPSQSCPSFFSLPSGQSCGTLSRFADLYCHSLYERSFVETNVRARVRLVVVSTMFGSTPSGM